MGAVAMLDIPMLPSVRESSAIFAPESYAAVRRPLAEAETMPPWCYTSPAFYRREVERIFAKVWNFIGRDDRIPKPGDYFTLEFVGIPIVVVRDAAGKVRAFANTCRHRGSLVARGDGNCRAFKCPYHSWTYSLAGELLSAPEMDESAGFERKDYGLIPIRVESWAGFLFVNFDDHAPPLSAHLGNLPQVLASHRMDDMVCVRRKAYDLACNWKIYVENAMEAYHVPTVHRTTLQRQKGQAPEVEKTEGHWVALYKAHEGSRALIAGDKGFPPIPTLEGRMARGSLYPLIYPSTMFGCTIDCMWWLELHPRGPDRTHLVVGSCFHKSVAERPDFPAVVENYYKRWDISIPEDNAISELQQLGLSSPYARPGRLAHLEPLVREIDIWVLDRVLGAKSAY